MGSSPLARGLRFAVALGKRSPRIIPARAGFTNRHDRSNECPADHPRSRGVYTAPVLQVSRADGSSPLARGLPRRIEESALERGIIPARAGFTPATPTEQRSVPDHPRSRGVYAATPKNAAKRKGSSPLARGLPMRCTGLFARARIIPARAGFTKKECQA